ncbi:ATP-binding protein [Candidatus Woesearchaeota archaeon]|nr:ATP-binding protein [Candidatus Woesearchaeota archaeon]
MYKFVITGGPCSGKSTVIHELARRGHPIVEESALHLIRKEKEGANIVFPWTDYLEFNRRVIALQKEWEQNISAEYAFLDRCLLDNKAYLDHKGLEYPEGLLPAVKEAEYTYVFILQMLPAEYWDELRDGHARQHPYADGLRIHSQIVQTYTEAGLPVRTIPFMPVEQRVHAIERTLKELYNWFTVLAGS